MRRRDWQRHLPWVGVPISAVFLAAAFQDSDLDAVWRALAAAKLTYLAWAVVLNLGMLALMALRWRLLLRPVVRVDLRRSFSLLAIGYLTNYVLPGRLGEVVRSYLLGSFAGVSAVAVLATIVVEKLLDGLFLLALLAILLRLVPLPSGAEQLGLYGSAVFLTAGGTLVALRIHRQRVGWLSRRFATRVPRIGVGLARLAEKFDRGLSTLELSSRTALVVILTAAIWGLMTLMLYALQQSLNLSMPWYAAPVLVVSLALGSTVPSAPGFVGTYQLITVGVLAGFAVARNDALAFSVLMHSAEYMVVCSAGLASLLAERTSFFRLFAIARSASVGEPDAATAD